MTSDLAPGLKYFSYVENGRRFEILFREAWLMLPAAVRRHIVRYWRGHAAPARLELMKWWSGWGIGYTGNTSLLGLQVRFCAPYVDCMSDDDVRFVIAHELAHVVQFARNDRRGIPELERDADAHALKWLGLSRRPRRTAKRCES